MAEERTPGERRAEAGSTHDVVVAGGGIAGLEALLALRHLAGDRVSLTLVSPEPEFTYRPMIVEEPFSLVPAERHDLSGIATELGTRLVSGSVVAVDPMGQTITLASGEALPYDAAIICVGARMRAPYQAAATLAGPGEAPAVNELLARAAKHPSRRIAFIVPPGVTWPASDLRARADVGAPWVRSRLHLRAEIAGGGGGRYLGRLSVVAPAQGRAPLPGAVARGPGSPCRP